LIKFDINLAVDDARPYHRKKPLVWENSGAASLNDI